MNMMSEQINELMGALAKAQGTMQNASKDKSNPFFKSKYADLASVWEACRESLSSNGLAVTQTISKNETGMLLITLLGHSSGQWIKSEMTITLAKNDLQSVGSALTYARRYSLSSIVGISPDDDDDGERAQQSYRKQEAKQPINGNILKTITAVTIMEKISQDKIIELLTLESKCDELCVSNCKKYMNEKFSCKQYADLTEPQYRSIKNGYIMNIKKYETVNA
jgi:hypothetical protein